MKLFNMSYVGDDTIRAWLLKWGIELEPGAYVGETFLNDRGYPSPVGDDVLLVCDPRDITQFPEGNPGNVYGGLTYPGGATAVYFYEDDITNLCLTPTSLAQMYGLRLVHEMLHHMNLPADDMDSWLDTVEPFWQRFWLKLVYALGFHNGTNQLTMYVQSIYYNHLLGRDTPGAYSPEVNGEDPHE